MLPDVGEGDRLSRVASALLTLARDAEAEHADVDAHYAPSECHDLLDRAYARRTLVVLRENGFASIEDVENAIAARTCDRVVHDLGFGALSSAIERGCRRGCRP